MHCEIYNDKNKFGLGKNVFTDITHVVHAGSFTPKNKESANLIDANLENVNFLKELFGFSWPSLTRFVNLSTLDVYAVSCEPINEKSNVKPISFYGASKFFCEELVKCFTHKNNIDYLNLRIGHVYGPGEEVYKKLLPVVINKIINKEVVEIWGDGSELRSYIFIDDVVKAIVNAIESSAVNLDINVVSGRSITIDNLVQMLINISGFDCEVRKYSSPGVRRDLIFDNKLLLEYLLDSETDLEYGLSLEFDYLKKRNENNF